MDRNGLIPVYMLLTFNGQRIRKSLKNFKLKKQEWNSKKGRVRPGKDGFRIHESLNSRLESIEETVHKINKTILKFNISLSEEYILSRIENPESIEISGRSFFRVTEEYLKSIQGVKAERTIKGSKTSFNFLQDYQKSRKVKVTFESINIQFFESLRTYAFEEKEISNNYFLKIISVLKTFLRWAAERGYHANYQFKKFRIKEVENAIIYLTMEELMSLYHFEFESKKLRHVRDIYCFCAFTGLRFSDVITLNESHIHGDYIVKTIQKTNEVNSRIPLSKYARSILEKYQGTINNPLPRISSQKFNDYIKECCELAGIDSPITKSRYSGSQRIDEIRPKFELITSHTARKTFVTNSLILGMKEMVVRNITGHKKEESFRRYVNIAENVKKNEMENTWDLCK